MTYHKYLLLLLFGTLSAHAELVLFIEENTDTRTVSFSISGTADISTVTHAEIRSGNAYFGAEGIRFGTRPSFGDPAANHQTFRLYTLDMGAPLTFLPEVSPDIFGNLLLDGTQPATFIEEIPIGIMAFADPFNNESPTNSYLVLPDSYTSDTAIAAEIIFGNSSLANFGFVNPALTNGVTYAEWGNGQDQILIQTSIIPEPAVCALVLLSGSALIGIRRIKFSPRFFRDRENDRLPHEPPGSCR